MNTVEKLLSIQKGLQKYTSYVQDSWQTVLVNEISKYPILIFSPIPIEVGVLIIDRENAPETWSVNISTLEEFVVKKLINQEKIEEFKKIYKEPEENYCAFVISDLGAQFMFFPK